jgi:hypothetical protein
MAIFITFVFGFMTLPLEVLSPALRRINDLTPYFMAQTRSRAAGAFVAIFPLTAESRGNKLCQRSTEQRHHRLQRWRLAPNMAFRAAIAPRRS